jgi:hypothetical protein
MKKIKVKALMEELLKKWLLSEQEMIDECCSGNNAIHATEEVAKTRKEYEQKIDEVLK